MNARRRFFLAPLALLVPCATKSTSVVITQEEARELRTWQAIKAAAEPQIAQLKADTRRLRAHLQFVQQEATASERLRTLTGDPKMSLVTPYIARIGQTGGNGGYTRGVEQPISTITSKNEHLLCAPTLIQTGYGERDGQAPRVPGLDKPLGTIVGSNKWGLVSAFLAKHNDGFRQGAGVPLNGPIHTITSRDHHALATSHLVKLKGTCAHGQALDAPMPTVGAKGLHIGEVRAFLVKYYSEGGQWGALDEPMGTITTRDRLGLVTLFGEEWVIADIGMRMLVPRELFRGNGFPDSYTIAPLVQSRRTKKPQLVPLSQEKQVDMCGNSVPPQMACAVVRANFVEQREEMAA